MIRKKVIALVCLGVIFHAKTFAFIGTDTVDGSFFREWYQTADLGHFLDNYYDYAVYETETTGEWNLGNQYVFSIAGNSFRQNKYHRCNGNA